MSPPDGLLGGEPPEPTAPNPSTAQARVLLDELARCGVRHVVLCPGSRSTALAVAADEHPALLLHVALDERGAGYLAVGIGRSTGQPAAVVTTSGTAVANLLPAVVEADHDRVPLLLLTADRPPELHGVGANQTIDQVGIFGGSTRWTVDLGVAGGGHEEVARWRWTACRAHGTAVGHPVEVPAVVDLDAWQAPGPVHVDVPFREPTVPVTDDGRSRAAPFLAPLGGRDDGAPWMRSEVEPHVPPERLLSQLGRRLARVPHGIVVVGGGVARTGPVADLAAALGWPLVAEPHVAIPPRRAEDAPDPVLAHGGLLLATDGFLRDHVPALAVRVGRPTVARETTTLLEEVEEVVVIDAHGGWVDRDDPRTTLVRGAAAPTVEALVGVLADSGVEPADPAWSADWRTADGLASAAVDDSLAGAVSEPAIARAVLVGVPAGGSLVVASSMPVRDLELVGGRRDDVAVHANRGASGIDGTVATALGVALGSARPTVALVGDLALLHDATAWLLRADPAGPAGDLVVVVVDNDGGGIFSFLPQRSHVPQFERLFGTPHGLDLAHLAALHRLGYVGPQGIDSAADVTDAVRNRLAAGGRHLVHLRTDRDENLEVHRRLRAAVADAVAGRR